jgi:hypothetical protein
MTYLEMRTRVGPDGVLTCVVPIGLAAANREVKITVEEEEPAKSAPIASAEEWQRFIDETAGSIADPTFTRQDQGEYEQRGEVFS